MVRQNPRSGPSTLERPRAAARRGTAVPSPGIARCEVSHGRTTVTLERGFEHPRHRIWAILTEPAHLEGWSPFTADRPLGQIGRANLTMLDDGEFGGVVLPSVVFVAETARTLEYSWAEDTVTWTLADAGADQRATRLTLHQTLADERMASAVAAGWHLCLDVAASVLDGHPTAAIRGMDAMEHGWAALNRRYASMFGVKPTRIG